MAHLSLLLGDAMEGEAESLFYCKYIHEAWECLVNKQLVQPVAYNVIDWMLCCNSQGSCCISWGRFVEHQVANVFFQSSRCADKKNPDMSSSPEDLEI